MKIINKILDSLFFVIPTLVFLIWLNGAYHGSRRHDIEPFDDSFDFVKCFYYGVERFAHPLNKVELNDYIKLSSSILINSETNLNINENFEIVRSRKILNKFFKRATKEEYKYIKDGAYYFTMYLNSRHKDIINGLISRNKISLKISKSTKYYSKLSCKNGMNSEIKTIAIYYKNIANEFNKILQSNDKEIIKNRNIFISNSLNYYKSIIIKRKKVFNNIFVD